MGNDRISGILSNIKNRCYNPKDPCFKSYGGIGVTLCDEWKVRGEFAKCYRANMYDCGETLSVDKDLRGGKEYSPNGCVLLPCKLNFALPKRKRSEGHTTGVKRVGNRYAVKVRNPLDSKNIYHGTFDTLEEAITHYSTVKKEYLQLLLSNYVGVLPTPLYDEVSKYIRDVAF